MARCVGVGVAFDAGADGGAVQPTGVVSLGLACGGAIAPRMPGAEGGVGAVGDEILQPTLLPLLMHPWGTTLLRFATAFGPAMVPSA